MAAERVECVDKTAFYEAVDVLKSQQKTKQSQITLFVEDKFYDKNADADTKISCIWLISIVKNPRIDNSIIELCPCNTYYSRLTFLQLQTN